MIYAVLAGIALYTASCAFMYGAFKAVEYDRAGGLRCRDGFHACKWCSATYHSRDADWELKISSAFWPLVLIAASGTRIGKAKLDEQKQPPPPDVSAPS